MLVCLALGRCHGLLVLVLLRGPRRLTPGRSHGALVVSVKLVVSVRGRDRDRVSPG